MEAHLGGLHAAAGELGAAAETLAALAAAPPVHPPLAAEEVSSSAASRFTAAGAVLASRAHDGSAVLRSAVEAIQLAATTFQAMNTANAALVSLHGNPGPTPAATATPAVTMNLPMAQVPIVAPTPRPGALASAITHAGDPSAGSVFKTTVTNYANAFRTTAAAVGNAATTIAGSLSGEAGPRITAALDRFGKWSDQMADNASTVGQLADQHRDRFTRNQQQTPTPQQFEEKRRELAAALDSRNPGLVAKMQNDIVTLTDKVNVAAASYHVGELAQAPPPPPAVVHVVEPTAAQDNPNTDPGDGQPNKHPGTDKTGGPLGDDLLLEDSGDGLDPGVGDPTATDPAAGSGDPMAQGIGPLVTALPGMLAAAAGGALGLVTSIPGQIGQQVQSAAGEAMQGLNGLGSGLSKPSDDVSTSLDGLGDTGGGLGDTGGGGGGDDGSTEPASAGGDLSGAGMAGMGGPTGPGPALTGYTAGPAAPPAAGAGLAGAAPMGMMPMGAGMGGMGGAAGGGTKAVKDADREIQLPKRPNSEPMKAAQKTVTADERPTPEPKAKAAVTADSKRRSEIVVRPKGKGGQDR